MLSRRIVRGVVIGVLLVLGSAGGALGQEGGPDTDAIARWVLEEAFTEACADDEEQLVAGFMDALAKGLGDDRSSVLVLREMLAFVLYQLGDYAGARQLLEATLSTLLDTQGEHEPQTLAAKNNLAQILKMQGDFAQARQLEEEVLSTSRQILGANHPSTLVSMAHLASTLNAQGDFGRGREILEEVLSIRRRVFGEAHRDTLTSMAHLASTVMMQGDYERGREILEGALSISRRVLGAAHPDTLVLMTDLANILHMQGDFSRSRKILEEVLPISRRVFGESHRDTLTLMANLAIVLNSQGDYGRGREILDEVMSTRRRVLGVAHPDTLASMAALASALKAQGDYGRAREIQEDVLSTRRRVLGAAHRDTLASMANLAITLHELQDLKEARKVFEEVLASRASTLNTPESSAIEALYIEQTLGLIYLHLGKPTEAAKHFLQALAGLENQTARSGDSEDSKSNFKARFEGAYRNALTTLLALGQVAEAHHVLERFRAQGFLTMLAERDIVLPEIPPELEARRRELAAQYDATIKARDKLYAREHRKQLFAVLERQREIRRERERLSAEIRHRAPDVADVQYPQPLTVEEIRQVLEPGTLMLSYFVCPEETILFVLSRDREITVHRLKVGERKLTGQIDRFFAQLQGTAANELGASREEMGRWLYEKLLEPAAADIEQSERLLIIADGRLNNLPFASLMRPIEAKDRMWQYLTEWKPVHSVLSATVYAQLQKWRPESDLGEIGLQIAAFGDPSYPGNGSGGSDNEVVRSAIERGIFDGLDPLPYTKHEVKEIGRLFPTGSARTFLGADATEENAKALGKEVRIAHFAAHGVTDPFTQLDSFIALSILDDQDENGLLQAWEIYERVRLDADLVVLSACETAFGPETDGEGLMSLSRAFQYAGARTVMASLWTVNDASTAALMIRFYKHLRAGKSKDEALQAAQLEFLQGPIEIEVDGKVVEKDYSSPYHWAAFQVIGDWQ